MDMGVGKGKLWDVTSHNRARTIRGSKPRLRVADECHYMDRWMHDRATDPRILPIGPSPATFLRPIRGCERGKLCPFRSRTVVIRRADVVTMVVARSRWLESRTIRQRSFP